METTTFITIVINLSEVQRYLLVVTIVYSFAGWKPHVWTRAQRFGWCYISIGWQRDCDWIRWKCLAELPIQILSTKANRQEEAETKYIVNSLKIFFIWSSLLGNSEGWVVDRATPILPSTFSDTPQTQTGKHLSTSQNTKEKSITRLAFQWNNVISWKELWPKSDSGNVGWAPVQSSNRKVILAKSFTFGASVS